MEKKRIIITLIFLSMFVVGTVLILTVPLGVKITYYQVAKTSDGELISFNVFEPVGRESETKPAILIGHGFIVNKEILKGYAIELAAAGFVAVPFDFRGHGMSTGELKSNMLTNDVQAIKSYLQLRGDIDMGNLGYIGYSMGGFPANDILKNDTNFKAFIGIGTGLTTDDNKVVYANSSRELNILMILGQFDEAFTIQELRAGMGKRLNMIPADVQVNQLYGSFKEGNASKIFLDDNSDHLTTAWDQDFIREARDWIINTFPDVKPVDEHFYVNIRALIFLMQIIGGIGFFFIIIEPVSSRIIGNREESEPLLIEDTIKDLTKKTIIYSFLYLVVGVAIMIPLLLFLPLLLAGAMITVLFGQVFGVIMLLQKFFKPVKKLTDIEISKLLDRVLNADKNLEMGLIKETKDDKLYFLKDQASHFPGIIVSKTLARIEETLKKDDDDSNPKSFFELLKRPFKVPRERIIKQIILGVILAITLYLILYLSIGLNYLGMMPSINKFLWIPPYFVLFIFIFLVFHLLFNKIFDSKFENTFRGLLKSASLAFGILMLYVSTLIIIPCIIIGNYFLIMILVAAIPIYLLTVFISALLYQKTGSILPAAIVNSLFLVLILATLSPFGTPLSLLSQLSGLAEHLGAI
jgi:dienelactone hydrolase